MTRASFGIATCVIALLVSAAPARANCQVSPIGEREQKNYLDLLLETKDLWRGYDMGGLTLEPTAGVPLVFSPSRAPERAMLFDAHAWIALSDQEDREPDDRTACAFSIR